MATEITQEDGLNVAIGNNVKALLQDKNGGNVSEFSRDADLNYITALDLVHGRTKSISFEVLERLCDYFGVGPSELFPYMPERKKSQVRQREDKSSKE